MKLCTKCVLLIFERTQSTKQVPLSQSAGFWMPRSYKEFIVKNSKKTDFYWFVHFNIENFGISDNFPKKKQTFHIHFHESWKVHFSLIVCFGFVWLISEWSFCNKLKVNYQGRRIKSHHIFIYFGLSLFLSVCSQCMNSINCNLLWLPDRAHLAHSVIKAKNINVQINVWSAKKKKYSMEFSVDYLNGFLRSPISFILIVTRVTSDKKYIRQTYWIHIRLRNP